MKLVVVESPGKIKKIQSFLPAGYRVVASFGHVRDLPKKELGVEFADGKVKPKYVTLPDSRKHAKKLKDAAADVGEVILATDPDREGEAIAWHVRALLGPRKHEYTRIIFNEITKSAVQAAITKPRTLDMDRVNAQQARRILDRLVGWIVSPFCWDIVGSGTSAGRVQSVALRMVVDREQEIRAFEPEVYFELFAWLRQQGTGLDAESALVASSAKPPPAPAQSFRSKLVKLNGKAIKRGFTEEAPALDIHQKLIGADWRVAKVEEKARRRSPPPPFITSTLQQAATNVFRWKPKQTMQVAQKLYEAGLITYMRTDAPAISKEAMGAARGFIRDNMKPEFLPAKPRYFKSKGNAQEAHECVRPTDVKKTPKIIESAKPADQAKLYRLIWERFISSQMAEALFDDTKVTIDASNDKTQATFEAKGSVLRFKGWLWIARKNYSTSDQKGDDAEGELPSLKEGEVLDLARLDTKRSETKPPNRYNQASLIRALEKEGIGRPATYAAIMETLLSRDYVMEDKRNLHATELGETLSDALVEGFTGHFMERSFTREIEAALDKVAEGSQEWQELVYLFQSEIEKFLAKARATVKPRAAARGLKTGEAIRRPCPLCQAPLLRMIRGRFSSLECSKRPECLYKSADLNEEHLDLAAKVADTKCPKCQGAMAPKVSVKNDQLFLSCLKYPTCDGAASIPGSKGVGVAKAYGGSAGKKATRKGRSSSGAPRKKGSRKKTSRKASKKTGAARGKKPSAPASGPAPECPKCASAMSLRRSAHGPFWGCTNYPTCKSTLDASES